ncbi:MAG TPA: carbohydrate kinase [Planctomycetota bacterium]|nr:carbohydrate kinase [Planctomycetota bacterium]
MKTIVAFGETLWDLLPAGPALGGAPCNFAYRAASLGDRAVIVTRLGRDDLGKKAFDQLAALGMETGSVQWDDRHPTGTVPVTIDAKGVPDFRIVKEVAYDFIQPVEIAADAVCFGSLVQRSPTSRRSLHRLLDASGDAIKFLDINLRKECYSREVLRDSLDRADIVKLNDAEAFQLRGMFGLRGKTVAAVAREVRRRWSLDACVVTRGERGALAVTSGEEVEVSGWKVEVVDTIGSGDAFSAAFLHDWLRGRSLEDCVFFGNALGALVARTKGATTPISTDEIRRFCGRSI